MEAIDTMETMTVTKFKATCLAVIERVRKTGKPLIITKNGEPAVLLTIAPGLVAKRKTRFGMYADKVKYIGDVITPLGTDDWEVLQD